MLPAISRRFSAARSMLRRLGLNDSGSVTTFVIAIPVLVGTVAIGVETGQLYRVKRQMQSAADDAAVAGTIDRVANKSSTVITSDARYETQRNGFTDGANGVVVTVNAPPASGPNVATPGAVEVIVTKTQSFSLGAVVLNWMGRSNSGFTVRARSVAAQGSTSATQTSSTTTQEGCIIALTPNNEQGISITSMNNFGTDCSIMSNGTATGTTRSTSSIDMSNFNNVTIHSTANDARIWTRGSFTWSSSNGGGISVDATLQNQTSSITDPYSSLGTPSPGSCTYTNYVEPSGNNVTLYPGTYCGGLSMTLKDNIYFTPGTYYIANGDLTINAKIDVRCPTCGTSNGTTTGVTIVLTQTTGNNADIGGVNLISENNVTLNAPSTGTYAGVLFYQDRRVAAGTMTSASKIFTVASLNNATLGGAVYFPQNRIDISTINNIGGNSTTGCTIWIGRYIKFSSFNNNYKGGCKTFNTTPAGITTTTTSTTTTTANKVME